jgi:hypothetical protein
MIRLPTRHKYGAIKTTLDGHTFDSRAEANYYAQLKLLQKAGEICTIQLQPRYEIIESYKHPETGKKVQPTYYVADFLVAYSDGRTEVVDVKGVKTEAYKIKKKLFESKYGKAIREVS